MDFLYGELFGYAADTAVGVVNKELKFEQFLELGKKASILNEPGTCEKPEKPSEICKESSKNETHTYEAYYELYNYLVIKKVIKQEFNMFSFITGLSIDTINRDLITNDISANTTKLTNLIKIDEIEINKKTCLQCYCIDHTNLSNFLTTYTYNPTAFSDIKLLAKAVGGKRKNIKRKNKTKRKNKSKQVFM